MEFETARQKMVDNQIRTTDVTEHGVLRAFLTVPRERFVPEQRRELAYIDQDVPLGGGRYLMEASPLAKLLQMAHVAPRDRALVVGAATGYTAALLSQLAAEVVALEADEQLAASAESATSELGLSNVTVVRGPLTSGSPAKAPYDVIVFDGSVEVLPDTFFDQLAKGGRMVVVEGIGNAALAKLYVKDAEERIAARSVFNCSIRMLPGFERKAAFVF